MGSVFDLPALVRLSAFAAMILMLLGGTASAFDYSRYQPEDLDVLIDRDPPAGNGVDVYPVRNIRLEVTLAAQAAPCSLSLPDVPKSVPGTKIDFLKWAMRTSGIPKEWIDRVAITSCVQVKSAKGKPLPMFIQDALSDSLAKEVAPGGKVTLYAMLVFFDQRGPGIVINEFMRPQTQTAQTGRDGTTDCGCGRDFHSGLDFSAPEGTSVPVMADGVVVKVEQDEAANVDVPSAGTCGRYVVVKHSYPNGRSAYTRYAELGRLIGNDGKPITIGQQVKAKDKIGEVGSQSRFHFEVRPVEGATADQTPKWTQLYAAVPGMEWSRYAPVDPQKFDDEVYGGKKAAATAEKN
ncbi:M23 family metallopeptidase [Bradyrhizobium sp.]|uniref:M23 family metallopeptidase n=1 Tax=Bradyrhizobium sp. TaxID=376 RepID=UPI003C58BA7B